MDSPSLIQIRMTIPPGYEESLIWQMNAEGWGTGLHQQNFPAGHLDDEPIGTPERGELVLVLEASRQAACEDRIGQLAALYGWSEDSWALEGSAQPVDDWENAWRQKWRPFRCAGFVIHTDFHDLAALPLRQVDQPLLLETGSAFGTGGHPSTRIALRVMRQWYQQQSFGKLLDVGAGSGILAVAAALMGAEFCLGMDPDPPSASQSISTAERNAVQGSCHFWRGTLESVSGKWEVVFANLQSGLLQRYAQDLALLLEPGGRLFTGGFMDRNEEATLASLAATGLRLKKLHKHGRWRAAEFRLG